MIRKTGKYIFIVLLSIMLILINAGNYLLGSFGGVEFATVVYQLNSSLEGTNIDIVIEVIIQVFVLSAVEIFLGLLFFYKYYPAFQKLKMQFECKIFGGLFVYRIGNKAEQKVIKWGIPIFIVILFACKVNEVGILKYISDITDASVIFEERYADPDEVEIIFPEEKKNVVFIYLESMETTYASVEEGGGKPVNYIPNLTKLSQENISFSTTDKMSGLYQAPGTAWTMAALLSTTSGIPYLMPIEGNTAGEYDTILPGLTTMGEVLEKEGYKNYFMCGSEAGFAGRKLYFEQHGNYEIYDYSSAKSDGFIPEDYKVFWGIEDQKLYEYAKIKLAEISKQSEPFHFTMLTVDTHHPEGYICELCKSEYSEQYANAIKCADKQIVEFLDWMKTQPWYEDTVIVVMGDHISMNNNFWDDLPEGYKRGIYNCFINTGKEAVTSNREASSLDIFPTTLGAMGVKIEGDRLGLGTNLFSDTPTLAEEMSRKTFNKEISKYSEYYNEKFIKLQD